MERELIDGIKIFGDESWIIILPDRSRPIFHVNAEAKRPELAEALVLEYEQKITAWINEA